MKLITSIIVCFCIICVPGIRAQTTTTTGTLTSAPATIVDTVPTPPAIDPTFLPTEPAVETATKSAANTATPNAVDGSLLAPPTETATATSTANATAPSTVSATAPSTEVATAPPLPAPTKTLPVQAAALKKANLLFKEKAYAEAIPYYEKARQADNTNTLILSNLGDCYRLTNNLSGKLNCYGELIRSGSAQPIHELYYGQALVENGESDKAKPFFEKYTVDNRGKEFTTAISKAKLYSKNADAYAVAAAGFNSTENDLCAVKFHDAVVFSSTRKKTDWIKKEQGWTKGNFLHLYSTQKTNDGYDSPPKLFMGDLNSKFNDGPVAFTKDYNTVYFTRNNTKKSELAKDGTYKLKILEASLDQNGFSMVKQMPFSNKDFNFAHPSISPDGFTLYFSSDMEGGKGGMDIYRCKRDSSGNWSSPENLGDIINSAGNEVFPFIAANGLLYFSSDGHEGMGGLDIYEGRLVWGVPKKIYNMGEPVNTTYDDFGIFLQEDNKNGYISSNRRMGGLDDDIYTLQILREVKRGKEVTLVVKDKDSLTPIKNAKIVINKDTVLTNDKGEYVTTIEEDAPYSLHVVKDDYFKLEDSVSTRTSPDETFIKELPLEKDPKLFLRALITDARTNDLLEGATIKVVDIETNSEVDNYVTSASGDYFKFMWGKKIGDRLTYLIKIDKPGYLQRTVVFTHTIDKPGEINLNEKLNLSLGKVEVGMDLAKMIDIQPIYFDLGKSDIRKDAALELDKIVQVMNEYPNMSIELGSHTDCRSSAASNLKLSTARAKASAGYIIKKGINKMRITGKGYGESKLLNNCACEGKKQSTCPEEEHTKNRRTEFLITRLK